MFATPYPRAAPPAAVIPTPPGSSPSSSSSSSSSSRSLPSAARHHHAPNHHARLTTPTRSVAVLGQRDALGPKPLVGWGDLHVFMSLLMSVIGAGMLSIPLTFVTLPWVQAAATSAAVAVGMAATGHALLHAHVQATMTEEAATFVGAGRNLASYRAVANRAFPRAGRRAGDAVSLVMAIGIFGGCVGGIRIVRDMMPYVTALLYDAFATDPALYAGLAQSTRATIEQGLLWGLFVVVIFPLCTLRRLSGLQVPNYLGFVFSLLLVGATVYRGATSSSGTGHEDLLMNGTLAIDDDPISTAVAGSMVTVTPVVVDAPRFARVAQAVCIYSYAFTMQLNLMPLFVELRGAFDEPLAHTQSRMTLGLVVITALCLALYTVFGLYASQLYGFAVQGNVLVNMESDPFMQFPVVAIFVTVLLTFPPLFHPQRIVIQELLHQCPADDLTWRSRVPTAAALLLVELVVAIWAPGIEFVFALVGATTAVFNCYVFPVLFFTRLCPWRVTPRGRLWCLGLWAIVAVVAVMGARTILFLLS